MIYPTFMIYTKYYSLINKSKKADVVLDISASPFNASWFASVNHLWSDTRLDVSKSSHGNHRWSCLVRNHVSMFQMIRVIGHVLILEDLMNTKMWEMSSGEMHWSGPGRLMLGQAMEACPVLGIRTPRSSTPIHQRSECGVSRAAWKSNDIRRVAVAQMWKHSL